MTDDLRTAVTERMNWRKTPAAFELDPDKERRAAALEQLRATDPVTANSEHLSTERAVIANYLHRKALATPEGTDAA